VKRDATAPTGVATALDDPADHNGWFNASVGWATSGSDGTSGIDVCSTGTYSGPDGTGLTVSGTCTDNAGNVSAAAASAGFDYDETNPTNVTFVGGGISEGGSYYYGSVPSGPTGCTADDATSGFDRCEVTGGGTTVGTKSYVATAYDNAGNSDQATRSYTVLAWTLMGFYQPVDMPTTWNTVKGGSTVPFKFNVFAGTTELTSVASVVGFTATPVTCPGASVAMDAIEVIATGGTSLRYDGTGGQFVYNWQTPKKPGACYRITMTTQDGSTLTANFVLK